MKEFNELRARARDKRDRDIATIQAEYAETLVRIASIEQSLLGRGLGSHRKISARIESVIPTDRPFTTAELLASLEALDPRRIWRKHSVSNHICYLRRKGLVRRLKRAQGANPAVYVRVGVQVGPVPFEGLTLPQVIAEVLGDRRMRQAELVVAMLDAGYSSAMSAKDFRSAVGAALRKDPQRFTFAGGKWSSGGL